MLSPTLFVTCTHTKRVSKLSCVITTPSILKVNYKVMFFLMFQINKITTPTILRGSVPRVKHLELYLTIMIKSTDPTL